MSDGAPIGDEVDGVALGRLLPSHASCLVVQQMDVRSMREILRLIAEVVRPFLLLILLCEMTNVRQLKV